MSHKGGEHGHGHGHGKHGHDEHGNPVDFDAYLARIDDPARDEWQQPDQVLAALAIPEGATVCELGVGPGYFTFKMAQAVGPRGHVFAVDVEPRMLVELCTRIAKAGAGARNITPILALPDDPLLPPASCDLILTVNTFHHVPGGAAYLTRLAQALRPGGRVANIDFHKRELPMGPPLEHKISRDDMVSMAAAAGLELAAEHTFLPHQYFLVLRSTA